MKKAAERPIAMCITGMGSRRAYYREKLESYGYSVIMVENRTSDIEEALYMRPNVIFFEEDDRESLSTSITTDFSYPASSGMTHTPIVPLQIL